VTDHRRLQRTLFRMQADPDFARALLSGDETARATTGLAAEDLALLEEADEAALGADPGGKRRTQIAGNAASEYLLTLGVAARTQDGPGFLQGFLRSPEFHAALIEDGRLPLYFGEYALRWAAERSLRELGAVATLERDMAHLRRAARAEPPRPGPGEIQLAATASVVRLPGGTLEWSAALRAALDAGRAIPAPALAIDELETLLLHVAGPPRPHGLGDVRLELLEPPADELLLGAATPVARPERAAFARAHGAEPEDLEAFLAPLVAEGVLVAGSG